MTSIEHQFTRIRADNEIEVASFGKQNSRVLIFRIPNGPDEWVQVEKKRVILVGGDKAKAELKRLLETSSRAVLVNGIPDGLSSSVHTAMREFVGLEWHR